jgi:4-amino-4-deoxy-L-arabinose transferase-like glycosyltransferase
MSNKASNYLTERWVRWALLGLIVLGFLVRAWGVTFGLPYLYHPDEPVGVGVAINMVKTGDLNPHSFGYGSLFFYLNALAYAIYYAIGHLIGLFRTPIDLPSLETLALGVGRAALPTEMLVGRGVSLLAGVLCIPLVYWLGKRLSSRRVGLLAAALAALSPTLVIHSQYVTPNMLVTMMSLAALVTVVRLTPQSRGRGFVMAGIALGAAVASKYNAVFLVPAYLVAYLLLFGKSILRQRNIYLSFLAAAMTFLVITPFALLDSAKFIDDTSFHVTGYEVLRHAGLEGSTLQFYLSILLRREGLLIFAALGAGAVYLVKRNRIGLILSAFAFPYSIYIARLWLHTDYTLMLIIPVLMIMAADAVAMLWRYFKRTPPRRFDLAARAGLVGLVAISIGYLGYQSVRFDVSQTTPDGREYARKWIVAHVPASTKIVAETYTPFLDPNQHQITYIDDVRLKSPQWYSERGYDLLVLSSLVYGRFYAQPDMYATDIADYQVLLERFPEIVSFDQNGVTIRILKIKR